jgi:hypothetical protein
LTMLPKTSKGQNRPAINQPFWEQCDVYRERSRLSE